MRKKTKVRRAIKVLSCDGLIVKYFAMIAVALLVVASTGCASKRDSWKMYCEKYNVNPDDPTEHEENFTWTVTSGAWKRKTICVTNKM